MEDEEGSFFSFQVGAATGDKNQIDVTIGGMGANILGFATPAAGDSGSSTPAATGDPLVSISGSTLTVNGTAAAAGDLVLSVPADIASENDAYDKVIVAGPATESGTIEIIFDAGAPINYSLDGTETVDEITADIAAAVNGIAGAGAAIDNGDGTVSFNWASFSGDYAGAGGLYANTSAQTEKNITVSLTGNEDTATIASAISGAINAQSSASVTDNGDGTITINSDISALSISADTNVAQSAATDDGGSDTPAPVDVPTAPVTSVANADDARVTIKAIDKAIMTVNIQRSELGAVSNRLSHTINNLTNISTNLSAAQGGIEDADFAHETTMLAKNQILQQASTAMLAQANASKQNVLSLLQG